MTRNGALRNSTYAARRLINANIRLQLKIFELIEAKTVMHMSDCTAVV